MIRWMTLFTWTLVLATAAFIGGLKLGAWQQQAAELVGPPAPRLTHETIDGVGIMTVWRGNRTCNILAHSRGVELDCMETEQ